MKLQIAFISLLAFTLPISVSASCELDTGKELFNKCAACHKAEQSEGHFVGPNLHGLVGRTVGSVEGFKFSRQMRKDNRVWNKPLFDLFINNPADVFPRTRMGFAGIKNSAERDHLFCYIKSLTEAK